MLRPRWALWTGACALAVAVALWALAPADRNGRAARESSALEPGEGRPEPVGVPERSPVAAPLEAALLEPEASKARAAAAALRRLLREDGGARRRVEALLLDPEISGDLRMALALVLGTLPGHASDAALLAALERFAGDTDFVRCALLALGATREPSDADEVFDLGDRPWGERGPSGLGITVRRRIEDPQVRQALARHLEHAAGRVRQAAATALRHTVEVPELRIAFLTACATEQDDGVAMILGEALAVWAGGAADPGERARVVRALLERAGEEGLDAYRFRLEDDLRRVALAPEERALLREYAHPSRPFAVRSFALSVLAGGADEETRGLLEHLASQDRDAAIRDAAARFLGKLPFDAGTLERLAAVARADIAWNVRYAAVEAAAAFGARPEVLAILRAATGDGDARVAARARALLSTR